MKICWEESSAKASDRSLSHFDVIGKSIIPKEIPKIFQSYTFLSEVS